MAQTIKLKRSSVSGNTPSTSDLELGEVAINTYDGKMFIKKNDGSDSIVEIGGSSGTVTEAFKTIAVSGQSSVVADSATDTLTLVAGSNMTITTNASGDTITFASSGGGGSQNLFSTFAVSGQNNVVADSTTDTLTFVAGSGITLTTDASADSITITNSATGANAFGNVAVSGQSTVAADGTNDTLTLTAGSGITLTTDASNDAVTIAATASAITVQDEGSSLSTAATTLNFVGAGVTASGTGATKTITIPGSSGSSFGTIAVSGQGSVVADQANDTLTLVAGSNVTLTTSAAGDSVTIASSGGGGGGSVDAGASITEFKYDVSSSTSAFSGSDANSNTLSYTAGAIQVYLNGILLDPATDYTATDGAVVTLTDAAASGDDLQIIAFNRKILNANTTVNTFTGNGSTTAFTLSTNPVNENNTNVFIDGVYQSKSNYSVSGTTLTFSTAPPNGSAIEVSLGFQQASISSTLDFADNAILRVGTGNDLQILHDGSDSIIKDTGTGDLQIGASTLDVKNAALNETMIKAIQAGAVELYHNNSKKLETVTGGVTVTGTVTATTFSGDLSGTINTATTGTTQSASDNSTKIATTAYVDTAVTNLVDSAPGTLNTLNELAAALGDDANFSTTITNSLATKVGLTATTGAANIPAGTTGQRPGSPAAGQFRYNSTLNQFEGYTSSWGAIGGGGTNTFTTDVFTGNGSLYQFTLSQAVSSVNDCIVHVGGIYQVPTDAYTVSGTTLDFGSSNPPANGRKIVVYSVKAGVSGNNLNVQTFSGDGSATSFTMSVNPVNENNTIVHIDGVYQQKTSYSTSGTTLTFSAAPANGTTIEVATFTQTEINVPVNDTIDTVHIKDDAVTSAKLGGNLVAPGTVTASAGFVGPLTGNVTGNVSGSAATVTGAAQSNITSVGTLTGLTLSGNLTVNANTNVTGNLTVDTNSFYVDATNNSVGIGTTDPKASTKLQVAGRGLFTSGAPDPGDGSPAGVAIGYDTSNAYGFIQAIQTGVANKPLRIQPLGTDHIIMGAGGARVGVGVTAPQSNLHVLGTLKVATGNAQGILGLGEGAGTTVNVGLWRGAANNPTSDGNFLNLGGYDGIVFAASGAAIGSQSERMRLTSAGILQIAGGGNDSVGEINFGNTAQNANRLQIRHQSSAWYLKTVDSDPLILGTSNQERLKLEANGNSIFQGNNHTNLQVKAGDNSTTAFLQTVQGSDARFGTSSNHQLNISTNGQFRLSIKNTGEVGIGTTDPLSPLSVQSNSTAAGMRFIGRSSDNISSIGFYNSGQTADTYYQSNSSWQRARADGGFHYRKGNTPTVTDVDGFTIEDMNVGIRTANPSEALEVYGSINSTYQSNNFATGAQRGVLDIINSSKIVRVGSVAGAATPSGDQGSVSFLVNSSERMKLASGGGIGVDTPSAIRTDTTFTGASGHATKRWGFGAGRQASSAPFYVINESNAGVYIGFGNQSWTAHSDERIKENVTSVGTVLPSLMNMQCVKYNLKTDPGNTKIGFIAQDWETNFPEVVDEQSDMVLESDGSIAMAHSSESTTIVKGLSYTETIPLLLKAIQEQQAMIETLQAEVTALKG